MVQKMSRTIEDMKASIAQAHKDKEELRSLLGEVPIQMQGDGHRWKVGKNYFIRTVTMHLTGKLVWVGPQELVLVDAAWIADDGRFSSALENMVFEEVEPFPKGKEVIVGRGSIIDAVESDKPLPDKVK